MAYSAYRRSLHCIALLLACAPIEACGDSTAENTANPTADGGIEANTVQSPDAAAGAPSGSGGQGGRVQGGGASSADAAAASSDSGGQGGAADARVAASDARVPVLVISEPPNQCVFTCATKTDCPPYFLHVECRQGKCVDLGCAVDADCTANGSRGLVCVGSAGPQAAGGKCRLPCSTVYDCLGGLPPDEAPDRVCRGGYCDSTAGVCRGQTCWADTPCSEDKPCVAPGRCIEYPDGTRACSWTCKQPSDCASPGVPPHDEDNQRCVQGTCVWIGCVRADECVWEHSGNACVPQ